MDDRLSRRDFLLVGLAAGAGLAGLSALRSLKPALRLKTLHPTTLKPGVVVAHGEDPAMITRAAIQELGGMEGLVSRGDVVVIKPNIAWDRPPELAANTNPDVVAELVRLCRAAGARRVKVFDHACSPNPAPSYERSGIAEAARRAGADVYYVNRDAFHLLPIPGAAALPEWTFYEEVLTCDVLINVPILKHHGTSRLTMALKNVFGMVGGDRGMLHRDIHRKMVDLNRVVKVDLTVLDAYRVLRRHGPTGGRLDDVDNSHEGARRVIVSRDPVAADAYGAELFGLKPSEVGFIREGYDAGLGTLDFRSLGLKEIVA